MMRKLPEERYQTPLEVAQALEPFAIEAGWTDDPGRVAAGLGLGVARAGSTASRPAVDRPDGRARGRPEAGRRSPRRPSAWAAASNAGPRARAGLEAVGPGLGLGPVGLGLGPARGRLVLPARPRPRRAAPRGPRSPPPEEAQAEPDPAARAGRPARAGSP